MALPPAYANSPRSSEAHCGTAKPLVYFAPFHIYTAQNSEGDIAECGSRSTIVVAFDKPLIMAGSV